MTDQEYYEEYGDIDLATLEILRWALHDEEEE